MHWPQSSSASEPTLGAPYRAASAADLQALRLSNSPPKSGQRSEPHFLVGAGVTLGRVQGLDARLRHSSDSTSSREHSLTASGTFFARNEFRGSNSMTSQTSQLPPMHHYGSSGNLLVLGEGEGRPRLPIIPRFVANGESRARDGVSGREQSNVSVGNCLRTNSEHLPASVPEHKEATMGRHSRSLHVPSHTSVQVRFEYCCSSSSVDLA